MDRSWLLSIIYMLDQSWYIIVSLGDVKTYHAGDAIWRMLMFHLSLIETTRASKADHTS